MKFLSHFLTVAAAAAETAPETAPELFFEPAKFVENLRYMGIGMLVIFVIIAVIILVTLTINKVFSKENKNDAT